MEAAGLGKAVAEVAARAGQKEVVVEYRLTLTEIQVQQMGQNSLVEVVRMEEVLESQALVRSHLEVADRSRDRNVEGSSHQIEEVGRSCGVVRETDCEDVLVGLDQV